MKLSPSQERKNRYEFERFVRKVVDGVRCDYYRQMDRHSWERPFADSPEEVLEFTLNQRSYIDTYPSDSVHFNACGIPVQLTVDWLIDLLAGMEQISASILLLSCGLGMPARRISLLTGIPPSTISRRRNQLLNKLRAELED